MAEHDKEPKDVQYNIFKEGTQWRVAPNDPEDKPARPGAQHLLWVMEKADADRGISAHFQFTHAELVENLPGGGRRLSEDWTAVVDREHPQLRLTLPSNVEHGTYYYAVMIIGDGEPQWAISKNPPPKIEVGG